MAIITHNDLSRLKGCMPENSGMFVVIDKNLASRRGEISAAIGDIEERRFIELEATESAKTIETVTKISQKLLELGADRDCFILGIGGGITTDVTGFVSSIYKRGVRFGFIPTTLLALADAAIGGKNGVNFMGYKNILGVIKEPEFVYATPWFLDTLPPRVYKEGVAEILKTFAVFDRDYFFKATDFFATHRACIGSQCGLQCGSQCGSQLSDNEQLTEIIAKCEGYKEAVVKKDLYEKGERRLLNFGHTFAHAIEKYCNDHPDSQPIMHGEAVALGMVLACRIAEKAGKCAHETTLQITKSLAATGLPVECQIPINELVKSIKKDKKVSGEGIWFVMPHDIGNIKYEFIKLEELYSTIWKI